jgi:Cu(I)/Ag(I) efflux system membrane fusion protein
MNIKKLFLTEKSIYWKAGAIVALVLVGYILGRLSDEQDVEMEDAHSHDEVEHAETLWSCSMHPQIMKSDPGDCPICGMNLIPVMTGDDTGGMSNALTLSESAKKLARIETVAVERRFPTAKISMVGMIAYDESRLRSITARFPARVDRLYVDYEGIRVNEGDHLALVYSPELLTAQSELLAALKYNPEGTSTHAAREKLRLWGLSAQQITEIVDRGDATDQVQINAPLKGIVIEKNVKEGDYVGTGTAYYKIADLSKLWVFLDAYESDIAWIRYGQKVSFEVEAYPGDTFHGIIAFIDPVMDLNTRTIKVRVNVANEDGRLKPGMFVRATVSSSIAEGGNVISIDLTNKWIGPMHPEIVKEGPGNCDICGMPLVRAEDMGYIQVKEDVTAPIVVPTQAVLRTGKRAIVYVELPHREKPTYEGREIILGSRADKVFIVKEGLKVGERVVVNGNFKIDSALQIQAKPSMMNPEGGGPMPVHDHGGDDTNLKTNHNRH